MPGQYAKKAPHSLNSTSIETFTRLKCIPVCESGKWSRNTKPEPVSSTLPGTSSKVQDSLLSEVQVQKDLSIWSPGKGMTYGSSSVNARD